MVPPNSRDPKSTIIIACNQLKMHYRFKWKFFWGLGFSVWEFLFGGFYSKVSFWKILFENFYQTIRTFEEEVVSSNIDDVVSGIVRFVRRNLGEA